MVKVSAELLDDLVNLAGETSIFRGRIEQQVSDAQIALNEMETTIERMRDQLRRLDIETQGGSSAASKSTPNAWVTKNSTRWKWTATRSCSNCRGRCSNRPPTCSTSRKPSTGAIRTRKTCCSNRGASTPNCRKA
jgi:hypothetical protein